MGSAEPGCEVRFCCGGTDAGGTLGRCCPVGGDCAVCVGAAAEVGTGVGVEFRVEDSFGSVARVWLGIRRNCGLRGNFHRDKLVLAGIFLDLVLVLGLILIVRLAKNSTFIGSCPCCLKELVVIEKPVRFELVNVDDNGIWIEFIDCDE